MSYSIGNPISSRAPTAVRTKQAGTLWLTISSALMAIAPKCPMCFLAYFGIFGVASTTAARYRTWIPVLTALSLGLTVGALAFRAHSKHRRGPVVMGVSGGVLIWGAKFVVENEVVVVLGLAILATAVAWCVFNQRRSSSSSCLPCKESRSFN
ncbi:MAG TPA: hypothetical protein VE863_04910 [Pyrinomonadaceae bacterium]|jgi:hypothetical protein|nr:hypothetical protein [Pyrinomonadaceae bacterium]